MCRAEGCTASRKASSQNTLSIRCLFRVNSLIIPFRACWGTEQRLQASCSGATVQSSKATGLSRSDGSLWSWNISFEITPAGLCVDLCYQKHLMLLVLSGDVFLWLSYVEQVVMCTLVRCANLSQKQIHDHNLQPDFNIQKHFSALTAPSQNVTNYCHKRIHRRTCQTDPCVV